MIKEKIIKSEKTYIKGKTVFVEQYLTEGYCNDYWRIKVDNVVLYDKLKHKPDIRRYKHLA